MGGGAWPFLVGGVICLVDSDNERDSTLLTSRRIVTLQTVSWYRSVVRRCGRGVWRLVRKEGVFYGVREISFRWNYRIIGHSPRVSASAFDLASMFPSDYRYC